MLSIIKTRTTSIFLLNESIFYYAFTKFTTKDRNIKSIETINNKNYKRNISTIYYQYHFYYKHQIIYFEKKNIKIDIILKPSSFNSLDNIVSFDNIVPPDNIVS